METVATLIWGIVVLTACLAVYTTVGVDWIRRRRARAKQNEATVDREDRPGLTMHEWMQLANGVGRVALNAMNEPDVKEDKPQVQPMPSATKPRRRISRRGRS